MRLGTRWASGTPAPAAVPAILLPAIAAAESDAADPRGHWTLTFLEGRPIAELDAGYEVSEQPDGSVTTERFTV